METKKCYTWDEAPLSWLEANITWAEACVIEGIVKKARSIKRDRHVQLDKEEKDVLITVITRIKNEQEDDVINSNKRKNKQVKVKIKDMEIFIKEITNIKVKIIL